MARTIDLIKVPCQVVKKFYCKRTLSAIDHIFQHILRQLESSAYMLNKLAIKTIKNNIMVAIHSIRRNTSTAIDHLIKRSTATAIRHSKESPRESSEIFRNLVHKLGVFKQQVETASSTRPLNGASGDLFSTLLPYPRATTL